MTNTVPATSRPHPEETTMADQENQQEEITAFKGFDANMQCLGHQFEIGGSYEHEGQVEA